MGQRMVGLKRGLTGANTSLASDRHGIGDGSAVLSLAGRSTATARANLSSKVDALVCPLAGLGDGRSIGGDDRAGVEVLGAVHLVEVGLREEGSLDGGTLVVAVSPSGLGSGLGGVTAAALCHQYL